MWTALGWDQKCEIPVLGKECGNLAFKHCNKSSGCWKGCNKKICMEHCKVEIRGGSIQYWHCKDGANNDCESAHDRNKYGMPLLVFIVGCFILGIGSKLANSFGSVSERYKTDYYSGTTSYSSSNSSLSG